MHPRLNQFNYIYEDVDIDFRRQRLIRETIDKASVSYKASDYNTIITEQDEIEDVDLDEFEKVLNGR